MSTPRRRPWLRPERSLYCANGLKAKRAPGLWIAGSPLCGAPTTRKISPAMSDPRLRLRPRTETHEKEPFMARLIFVNLPVSDLKRANAFYQAIGAVKNE